MIKINKEKIHKYLTKLIYVILILLFMLIVFTVFLKNYIDNIKVIDDLKLLLYFFDLFNIDFYLSNIDCDISNLWNKVVSFNLFIIKNILILLFLYFIFSFFVNYKKKYLIFLFLSLLGFFYTLNFPIYKYKMSCNYWGMPQQEPIKMYDNSKLKSEAFDANSSILTDTINLIGPITVKYDLSNYQKSEESKGFIIKKYIWDFGEGEIIEKIEPTIIHDFNKKGNYDVSLIIEEIDLNGKLIEKLINDIKPINIDYIVNINEKKTINGGIIVEFDASDVSKLGNIEWYYGDDLEHIWKGEIFKPGKPIFEETLVGMSINTSLKETKVLDKIFIISGENKKSTKGTIIEIPKELQLKRGIEILNENEIIENIRYNPKNKEYFIDKLLVPTVLTFDARLVKSDNILYNLKDVTWDIDSDGDIDGKGKIFEYPVDIGGNHYLTINYAFTHKKIKGDTIFLQEVIYIEGVKKEALLNLKIEKDSNYAPVLVRFDTSKSQVKNQNMVKSILDYGDGTIIEEVGVIKSQHKYDKFGNYIIKLTVVTEEGNKYSIEKELILNPKPQNCKINVINKSIIEQDIKFSSEKSEGQIESYFWDFGDRKTSFKANPSHTYTKSGKYKVKLKCNFANNNQLIDIREIEIY